MVRANGLGGQGLQISLWSQPKGRLRGMVAPNGWGPRARGTGSPNESVVATEGALAGDASPTGASSPTGGTGSHAQLVVATEGAPAWDGIPQRCGPMRAFVHSGCTARAQHAQRGHGARTTRTLQG